MNLTTVIPCHSEDAVRAEKLLDLILFLQNKEPEGHGVIVIAPDVQQEMRDKLRLTAELVFRTVEVLNINPKDLPQMERTPEVKSAFVDAMFEQVARRMSKAYKDPWLWLEPDCVPLVRTWKDRLLVEYMDSPKRYCGVRLSYGEAKALTMHCVFPADSLKDMEAAWAINIPFRFYAFDLSSRSSLIQLETITSLDDVHKVSKSAVLLHGDKSGVLIDWVMEQNTPTGKEQVDNFFESIPLLGTVFHESPEPTSPEPAPAPKRRGRPPKKLEPVSA